MTITDKEEIGLSFEVTIMDLTARYNSLSAIRVDVSLESELADCIRELLGQYNKYKGAFKSKHIDFKRDLSNSLVLTFDAELQQLRTDDAPANAFDTESARCQVEHSLNLTTKPGVSRAYQLRSCEITRRYVLYNLREPELSFVLSPPVTEWLEEMRDSYQALSKNTMYSMPQAAKGLVADVDKMLLEMVLWQRNVDAFATSVVMHRQDSDERNRLIEQAEARQRQPATASCLVGWCSCR
jgi:hypothetical protein